MSTLKTYSAVKDPLKSRTNVKESKRTEMLSAEIKYRLKLIEKAFK